jgi:hypothetical protein
MTARYIPAGPPLVDDRDGSIRMAWECPAPAAIADTVTTNPDAWHCAVEPGARPRAVWWQTDWAARIGGPARKVRQTRTVGPWTNDVNEGAHP